MIVASTPIASSGVRIHVSWIAIRTGSLLLLCLTLLCLLQGTVLAAESKAPGQAGQLLSTRFVRYGMDEGLSSMDVRAVAQDRRGFIWLGTSLGGLNRFDGYNFKSYLHDPKDPSSLSHNYVTVVFTDAAGTLWVGTAGGGLNRYIEQTDSFERIQHKPKDPASLSSNAVLSITQGKDGALWIGTRNGLNRMDLKSGEILRVPLAIDGKARSNMQSIRTITEDPKSALLWLGTSDGLFAYDLSNRSSLCFSRPEDNATGVGYNSINEILADGDGTLWLGTEYGLCRFHPDIDTIPAGIHPIKIVNWETFLVKPSKGQRLGANVIRSAVDDHAGSLWLGSADGLSRFDKQTHTIQVVPSLTGEPDSLASGVINKLFIDRQHGLWVGTSFGGVNRMRTGDKPFRNYSHIPAAPEAGLSHNVATSVFADSKKRLWVGTLRGLSLLENGIWRHFRSDPDNPNSLSDDHIASVMEDSKGDIWVGTANQGINRFDGTQFHRYLNPIPGLTPHFVRLPYTGTQIGAMYLDKKQRLWINAKAYGLECFEDGAFTHRSPMDDAGNRRPFANLVPGYLDDDEGLWCASELNGLVRLHIPSNQTEQFFPGKRSSDDSAATLNTYMVAHDGAKGLWLASISGLHHFDIPSRTFDRSYYASDGLPSDAIFGILRDSQGLLWLSSANGLARFDPLTGHCRSFLKADGLPSNQFMVGSVARDSDGRLYFGSIAGVCSIFPALLRNNPIPPETIVFSELELFDKPVTPNKPGAPLVCSIDATKSLTLSPEHSVFTLRFSALDFNAPTRAKYAYIMEGFDRDWRIGYQHSAYYMNLPPGDYVFKVRGSNADDVWNITPSQLQIRVLPNWYQSALFRWTLGLSIAAILGLLYLLRINRVNARNRELHELVDSRTADLLAEVTERRNAEEALRESHLHLEERVTRRTSELADSNKRLKQEIEEKIRIESDLRASQETLRQTQKTEALGMLAGGVAHDFNNILTVILGQAQCATDPELSQSERDEAINDIQEAARRAAHLTRQLLIFGRKQAISITQINPGQIVTNLAKMIRSILREDITLTLLPLKAPLPVMGDASMLEQVVMNLALNARDAMTQGGELSIGVDSLFIASEDLPKYKGCPRPGLYTCIHVKDTGPGISPEVGEHLFEPFFTTKPAGHGTGLGLATSLRIVQQHGGWMQVSSPPGQGAEFQAYIPAIDPAGSAPASSPQASLAAKARPVTHSHAKILIVEDEPGVRNSTARMLRRWGYTVIEAANADEALGLWDAHGDSVDLLLSDVVMPGSMNGHALASALRQRKPTLKVQLMSGYDPSLFPSQTSGLPTRGDTPLLLKPFSINDLIQTIQNRLQ